jgi:hypothetical protein
VSVREVGKLRWTRENLYLTFSVGDVIMPLDYAGTFRVCGIACCGGSVLCRVLQGLGIKKGRDGRVEVT